MRVSRVRATWREIARCYTSGRSSFLNPDGTAKEEDGSVFNSYYADNDDNNYEADRGDYNDADVNNEDDDVDDDVYENISPRLSSSLVGGINHAL